MDKFQHETLETEGGSSSCVCVLSVNIALPCSINKMSLETNIITPEATTNPH